MRSSRPIGVDRLGCRWVLFRDETGKVACLPAACPHRGADLALGRVRGGAIECHYHGFRFTSAGVCTAMPCEGRGARIPERLRATPAWVREAGGLVWMWFGRSAPTAEPPWIEGAPEPGPRNATHEESWEVCFTRVMEGMQDLHHFPFAHRKLDPFRGRAARLDPFELELDGEVFRQRGSLRADEPGAEPVAAFEIGTAFPSLLHLVFGDRADGTVAICPIDDDRTWIWTCYRVRTGLGRFVDRLASWFGLWLEFKLVQPDDRRMLASSRPARAALHHSTLVRSDAAIAAWHKLRRARLAADTDQPDRAQRASESAASGSAAGSIGSRRS